MISGRYVHYEGKKLYFDEIEQMPIESIEKVIQAVAEQQLNTSIRIDSAKSRMVNNDPIDDDDFICLKTKIKILNLLIVTIECFPLLILWFIVTHHTLIQNSMQTQKILIMRYFGKQCEYGVKKILY